MPERIGTEAQPLSPNTGPGALGPGQAGTEGSSGSPALVVGVGGWIHPLRLSPHPASQGQTQGHSRLPRRAYGAARVAFKISLTNQIWLFQEAWSLAVLGRAGAGREGGRDLHIPGFLAGYPLWPRSREHPGPSPALERPGPVAISSAKSSEG